MNKAQHVIDCIVGYNYGTAAAMATYPDPGTSFRMSLRSALSCGITEYYHGLRDGSAGDWVNLIVEQLEAEDDCWGCLTDHATAERFGREVMIETLRRCTPDDADLSNIHAIMLEKAPSKEFGDKFCKYVQLLHETSPEINQLKVKYMVSKVTPLLLHNGYSEIALGIMTASGYALEGGDCEITA